MEYGIKQRSDFLLIDKIENFIRPQITAKKTAKYNLCKLQWLLQSNLKNSWIKIFQSNLIRILSSLLPATLAVADKSKTAVFILFNKFTEPISSI